MRLLINIRGCNGSGKSTFPMQMLDDPDLYVITKPYKERSKRIATVFPKYKTVALGTYFNKTGGLDLLPTNDYMKKCVRYVLKKFPDYDVLMEGILASTIRSTYINFFHEVEREFPDTQIVVIHLVPPLEVCVERAKARCNNPINEEKIRHKNNSVHTNIKYFKAQESFINLTIDTSKIPLEQMLPTFRREMGRCRERSKNVTPSNN